MLTLKIIARLCYNVTMESDEQKTEQGYWETNEDQDEGLDTQDAAEGLAQDDAPIDQSDPTPEEAEPSREQETSLVTWEASEYIVGEKNVLWFVGLGLVAAALIVFAVITDAWTFVALIVVAAIALIVYAFRPSPPIAYELTNAGVHASNRFYGYADFKSFGYLKDGAHNAVILIPKKRFSPGMTIYFPEEQGEKIIDVFGARLPMQDVKLDIIDKLIRKLKI